MLRPTLVSPAASGRPPAAAADEDLSSPHSSIASLIVRASSTTAPTVDPLLLRTIKSSARASDAAIRLACRTILSRMANPHSHVRLLAFLIADELFMRSKLFRSLLSDSLESFLPFAVGFRRSHPLPPPAASAATLRKTAVLALGRWHHRFGAHYRQLRIAVDYLKNSLRIEFPDPTAAEAARSACEARTQEILASKVEQLRQNITAIKDEIWSTIDEIRNGLEIVRVENERFEGYVDDEDTEEDIASLEMRKIRMVSLMAGEKLHETLENRAVFDALREAYRLLLSKHLVTVQEWISVLVRVELPDNRFRDSALKEFIDVKNEIQVVRSRCSELGLVLDDACRRKESEEEEDDFWDEGKIEVPTPERVSTNEGTSKGKSIVAEGKSYDGKETDDINGLVVQNPVREKDPERARLLAEAPVLPWSLVLDNWGSGRDALVNHRGLELESHWGRMDNDAVIPAAKIAELSVHSSVYKEERVEIQPCLAPLRKGGLCQRRDLKVCPFHGPIIPRDVEGNPIEQNGGMDESVTEPFSSGKASRNNDCSVTGETLDVGDGPLDRGNETLDRLGKEAVKDFHRSDRDDEALDDLGDQTLGLGKETIEQLAKRAIKNVRKRDRDDKALERAQRARIRQHNEDVLREAALASTSHSTAFGQPPEVPARGGRRGKIKEPTLASMLKKKVTTKDRIEQRLMNARVRDATIRELSQGEDLHYREAFPNQW